MRMRSTDSLGSCRPRTVRTHRLEAGRFAPTSFNAEFHGNRAALRLAPLFLIRKSPIRRLGCCATPSTYSVAYSPSSARHALHVQRRLLTFLRPKAAEVRAPEPTS